MKAIVSLVSCTLFAFFIIGLFECNYSANVLPPIVNSVQKIDTSKVVISIDTTTLTQQNVYNMIIKADIQYPKIVLKQALLETGHFKSPLCKYKHNLFGFTTSNGYMQFDSYQNCIETYKRWQDNLYYKGDYYVFLEQIGYAECDNYVETLKKIKINVQSTNQSD